MHTAPSSTRWDFFVYCSRWRETWCSLISCVFVVFYGEFRLIRSRKGFLRGK